MTDKPDTTREAVERLAADYDDGGACVPDDKCRVQRADCCLCARTATTLRALAADNDALRAEVAALRQAVERARGEALEEAAALIETHVYSQGASGPYLRHAADARLDTHHATIAAAIRARAGGAGDE
jgi:hypothetical protein